MDLRNKQSKKVPTGRNAAIMHAKHIEKEVNLQIQESKKASKVTDSAFNTKRAAQSNIKNN